MEIVAGAPACPECLVGGGVGVWVLPAGDRLRRRLMAREWPGSEGAASGVVRQPAPGLRIGAACRGAG
ncbi:hypothetical protein GCM10027615_78230 [Plantactinospora veratri]